MVRKEARRKRKEKAGEEIRNPVANKVQGELRAATWLRFIGHTGLHDLIGPNFADLETIVAEYLPVDFLAVPAYPELVSLSPWPTAPAPIRSKSAICTSRHTLSSWATASSSISVSIRHWASLAPYLATAAIRRSCLCGPYIWLHQTILWSEGIVGGRKLAAAIAARDTGTRPEPDSDGLELAWALPATDRITLYHLRRGLFGGHVHSQDSQGIEPEHRNVIDDVLVWRAILIAGLFWTASDSSGVLISGLWEHVVPVI
ncbi:hypothetical protein MFIFM68171_10458 [Madurella fahalii]|uniref:Uncharacterized protein n=1 Tax=Madurella fahalii TaxID=1157608 RepID=A0ABQ0GR88_9PEZI